ncbi:MAG: MerR family transcriptional regulator [Actinoplanes sp.]
MRSIGELARASGLSVSALRFYDGAGVLTPAEVDPATGYRRYAEDQLRVARLIAGLRRVGMPVSEIARAVRAEPGGVRRMLDDHRRRLEDGLADARRELLRIHTLLDLEENLMTRITLPAAALAATLDAVLFAAGTDPELPMLGSVLVDAGPDAVTLVATDRYRLAVAEAAAAVEGPPIRSVLPLADARELRAALTGGEAVLDLTADRVRAEAGGRVLDVKPMDVDYPDHRRLVDALGSEPRRVTFDVAALRSGVIAAPVVMHRHEGQEYQVTPLSVDESGVRVATDGAGDVVVQREFLLEALAAGRSGQLVLELDGPIRPLAVRVPGDESRFSILMPVKR